MPELAPWDSQHEQHSDITLIGSAGEQEEADTSGQEPAAVEGAPGQTAEAEARTEAVPLQQEQPQQSLLEQKAEDAAAASEAADRQHAAAQQDEGGNTAAAEAAGSGGEVAPSEVEQQDAGSSTATESKPGAAETSRPPSVAEAAPDSGKVADTHTMSAASSRQSSIMRLVIEPGQAGPSGQHGGTPIKQMDMSPLDSMPLAQLAATSRGSPSRLPSSQDRGLKVLRSLSRQGSAARAAGAALPLPGSAAGTALKYDEVQVANAPTSDDAFVLNTDSVAGAGGAFPRAQSSMLSDSDTEFSESTSPSTAANVITQPGPAAAAKRVAVARVSGNGGGSAPAAAAPDSRPGSPANTSAMAAARAGSKEGSRADHMPASVLPIPQRIRGAAPFMERHASPAAMGSKRVGGQGLASDKPQLKPLKGLATIVPAPQPTGDPQVLQPDHAADRIHLASAASSQHRPLKSVASGLAGSVADGRLVPPYGMSEYGDAPAAHHVPDAMLDGLFLVRGLKDKHAPPLLQQPRKARKQGRINFRTLFGPPAHTGGGTLPPSMIKQGLARRAAAAAMMTQGPPPFVRKAEPRPVTPEGVKLDGFMMLEAGDEDLPEHVVAAKLSHRNIDSVEAPDMSYFPALKVLDLSDNRVPGLGDLAGLLGLRQLSLASNRLHSIGSWEEAGAFQELQTLDLTYNSLKPSTLGIGSPLAGLPHLRELDLSGNSLSHLPEDMGTFPSLTLLRLNHNRLSGAALVPLSALPSLRELSLSGNVVTAVYDEVADPGAFPQLRLLDLTNNKITDEAAVSPLKMLPSLRVLLLAGNPLAVVQQAVVKKARDRGIKLEDSTHGLQVMYKPLSELPPKTSIATILANHNHQVPKTMDAKAITKAAGEAAIAATSEDALVEAFDRVDNAIDAWQLNTVDEEEEEEEDTGPMEEDGTFLTGVGIEERHKKQRPKKEESDKPVPAPEIERPLWEDVTDPTERLALALGLDPRQLAIHTGRLTTDSVGAINALRFALAHPLVEADEGLKPAQHHLGMTTAARLKRRDRKLAPLPGAASAAAVAAPPDIKTVRIQTMEDMLQGMKDRLKGLEASLADKLAAAQRAGAILPAARSRADGMQSDDEDNASQGSPLKEGPSNLGVGGQEEEEEDARSDASPLPDDVIDAVENPALSDTDDEADNYLGEDQGDQDAAADITPRLTAAGTGPTAARAAAAEAGKHADVPSSAAGALGYI